MVIDTIMQTFLVYQRTQSTLISYIQNQTRNT